MSDKQDGLYQKYVVQKIKNPEKKLDCVVLEFDDPIAIVGIKAWAKEMFKNGYHQVAEDVWTKIEKLEKLK
jgi:hypothetical protein